MNNPRLQGVVTRFANEKKIEGNLPDQYQIFVNYLILKQRYYEINGEYPYESILNCDLLAGINFGKNSSMAVDGCIIIHEKEILHLGMEDDDLNDKLNKITEGELNIILIQTKTGKIEPTDLSTLSDCMNSLFKGQPEWEKLIVFREKCNQLLEKYPKVKIMFGIYYVTGNPLDKNIHNNATFQVRKDSLKEAMKNFFWIGNEKYISLEYVDDEKTYSLYEEQNLNAQTVTAIISFVEMTNEIDCGNSGKIRFGAVTFKEFMKILWNSEKQKTNELYGYNVRDALKNSEINKTIQESIRVDSQKFLLLNNGATIIVDNQERKGEKGIHLENIRIVNGCQTSHAIFNTCKDNDSYNDAKVPIKIIETRKDDNTLLGDITFSSNNQNEVTKANLFAIHPKMFELEKRYKDFQLINRNKAFENVYFERRQGQYNNQTVHYIDMLAQAKAYLSMWKRIPHFATMYADQSLETYKSAREEDTNFLDKSFVSGILWFNIYKNIPALYENARYHIFSTIVLNQIEKQLGIEDILSLPQETFEATISKSDIDWVSSFHIDIHKEIDSVIKSILLSPERFTTTKTGKIHYRKFYPPDAIGLIYKNYKQIYANA